MINNIINKKETKNSVRNKEIKENILNNIKNSIDAYELKIKKEKKNYYPKYKKSKLNLFDIDKDIELFQNIKTTILRSAIKLRSNITIMNIKDI